MLRYLGGVFILGAGLILGLVLVDRGSAPASRSYERICSLVESKIYLEPRETASWSHRCRVTAQQLSSSVSKEDFLRVMNDLFGELAVSHLEIYPPQEVLRLWQGMNRETGIESQFVDGALVIFRVHRGSPAHRVGLKPGDVILAVQGQPSAPVVARTIGGEIRIQRQKKIFEVNIEPEEILIDENPSFTRVNDQTLLLRVPSLRSEFFSSAKWDHLIESLPRTSSIVVDLRGNSGGNFVAGLRMLAPFMCEAQDIGFLLKPRSKLQNEAVMPDDLQDETQLRVLDAHDLLRLRTPSASRCLTARVAVLTDSGTASTAEMVTQALKDYVDARVMGVSTAGQLLVGVWYDLPELGEGWRISIPEAVYQSKRGKRLEGAGIRVDRELYYDLNQLMAGRDSWVAQAVTDLRREPSHQDSRSSVSK